jgi:hypothetical protein
MGNNYGVFSDRRFQQVNLRIWQVAVLVLKDHLWGKVLSARKEASKKNTNVSKKQKKKNKKKGKKQEQNEQIKESKIYKEFCVGVQEEEEMISKIDKKGLVQEVEYLVGKINDSEHDLDFFCARAKIFKNNFVNWKEKIKEILSLKMEGNLKVILNFVSVALNEIFGMASNTVIHNIFLILRNLKTLWLQSMKC